MASFYAGWNGELKLGANTYCITEYTISYDADILDTTTTCSGGDQENVSGIISAKLSCKANWDSNVNPFTATPDVLPGDTGVATVKIGSNKHAAITYRVQSVTLGNQVRGLVPYSFELVSNGSFNLPS